MGRAKRADRLIVSTESTAVWGTGSHQRVQIEGTVAGFNSVGIFLGNTVGDSNDLILVTATGVVSGLAVGVDLNADSSSIFNFGLIEGYYGISLEGAAGTIFIQNSGTIHGEYLGVYSSTFVSLTLVNTGTITGISSGLSILAGDLHDSIRNLGHLFGGVDLGGGNDLYDGRSGTIEGTIFGGEGNDIFRLANGEETVDGGGGIDTLDFRSGGAIHVALDGSFANTGAAMDDVYTNIESILGSMFGNDMLTGSFAANTLRGNGGDDSLSGAGGNDRLFGGAGIDVLTGGAGNDHFCFQNLGDCGDLITDFRNIPGNNDDFHISAAGFGGGLVAGALAANQFQIGADNLALTSDVRFIFNTTDQTLWFDVNGNAAGGLTMLADLQAGAIVSAADIILV